MSQLQGFIGKAAGAAQGKVWRWLECDLITHVLKVIDYYHAEVHGGGAFRVFQSVGKNALDISSPLTFHVVTHDSAKWMHLEWKASATTEALLEIFQDDGNASHFDVSSGDVEVPTNHNHNLQTDHPSLATIKSAVTVTQATTDARIFSEYVGLSKSKVSNSTSSRIEDILKQNTEYLFRLTTIADNNEGDLGLDWYEHTNKD